ncbi:hypothetical protein MNBD_PLANCTO03-784 [hydrothermal vent metagenome]|uniref:Uncharacterized protein n=1 Tax=hydrothermal vent metagenome TaxID=652676 RepID=A0A3B1E0V5_9ZZZZ
MFKRMFPILTLFSLAVTGSSACAQGPIFADGFEDAETFLDLFPLDESRWSHFGITGEGNTLDLSQEQVRSGTQSLKCFAMPYDGVTASKAYIANGLFQFFEGDEAWFEAWFYVEGTAPPIDLFLWDLEAPDTCTSIEACPEEGDGSICSSPGRRLYLQQSTGTPVRSDLGKWCLGEDFRQIPGSETHFPTNQWVRLRVFIGLSSRDDGIMQVWQDDELILHNRGYTLPRADSIYNSLQVGNTANGGRLDPATLFLDDVTIWNTPPIWWLAIFDRDGDGLVSIDDSYELHANPADLNDDSVADRADIDLLEAVIRWDELPDMRGDR